jgi:hypothetical protein
MPAALGMQAIELGLSVGCDLSGSIRQVKCPLEEAVGEAGRCESQPRTDPGRGNGRMMKIQEVVLKAMSGELKWEAAEILGITDRQLSRIRERYAERGYDGLYDYRKGNPPPSAFPWSCCNGC